MSIFEIVGYTGSVLVALSLTMRNVFRLRIINFFGASTFAVYGFLVDAYPVLLLNSFISLVDVYYLWDMFRRQDHFSLMPVLDDSHPYLNKFVDFHFTDIKKFFPDFSKETLNSAECYFILRNLMPVGIFVFEGKNEKEVFVHLDYAIPDYRDLKNAKYLYSAETNFLKNRGFKKLLTRSEISKHIKYLKNNGFIAEDGKENSFVKNI